MPVIISPTPPITAPRWSSQTPASGLQTKPIHFPKIHFALVNGGLWNKNIISQEAIHILNKRTWGKALDICTPNKLCPTTAPSCLDFKQVAMPMVHPTTIETIRSYKQLMHNPATAETLQTIFGKDFGGMVAQGDNKTSQKGTNSIFVMTHDKIKKIL